MALCNALIRDQRHDSDHSIPEYDRRLSCPAVSIVTATAIPGANRPTSSAGPSNTTFTGIRCTTLTKFPVAFSGGGNANTRPLPRRSCPPALDIVRPWHGGAHSPISRRPGARPRPPGYTGSALRSVIIALKAGRPWQAVIQA